MQTPEKTFLELIIMGALIAVAKLLVSSEKITARVVMGRAILGSATSMLAGLVLLKVPNIDPMALLGIGSALGIIGQQYVEKMLRKKLAKIVEDTPEAGPEGKVDG